MPISRYAIFNRYMLSTHSPQRTRLLAVVGILPEYGEEERSSVLSQATIIGGSVDTVSGVFFSQSLLCPVL